jgi:lipopolysaccharide/colanic/teichoic acid biosynthesis glycosyltransferase
MLLLVDLILIAISTALALILRDNLETSPDRLLQILPYLLLTLSAAVPVLLAAGLNRTLWRFTSLSDCLRVAAAVVVTVLVAVAAGFSLTRMEGVARSLPIMQGLLMACTLIGVRVAMRLRHAVRGRNRIFVASILGPREAVLVVGLTSLTDFYLRCVAESPSERVMVAGLLAGADRHRRRLMRSCPILGAPEDLEKVLSELGVHGIFITRIVITTRFEQLSPAAQKVLLHIEKTSDIRLDFLSERIGLGEGPRPPPAAGDMAAPRSENGSEGAAVAAFALAELAASRPYLRWKRVLDTVVAVVLVVCLAPVMLLVALVVMLDVGYPAIFWQQRPGVRGWPIRVLKFRTMGPARDRHDRPLADAERLSMVGRCLRRLRLDELPQVYNVITGQMSLVGPRPLLPIDQSPGFTARLAIRPGLTGWAQIKGGRDLSVDDKAALDIWYVRNASLRLDAVILLSTLRTVFYGERIDRDAIRQAWRELGSPDALRP